MGDRDDEDAVMHDDGEDHEAEKDDKDEDKSTKKDKKEKPAKGDKITHLSLPLARVKKIMKIDKDVKLISSDAALLIGKATEFFIEYFVQQGYRYTAEDKRKILNYKDLAAAVKVVDSFEFLTDIIPEKRIFKSESDKKKVKGEKDEKGDADEDEKDKDEKDEKEEKEEKEEKNEKNEKPQNAGLHKYFSASGRKDVEDKDEEEDDA